MRDPYLYPNSNVLKNLADLRDQTLLDDMEADYTALRLSEIVTDINWLDFNFQSLCYMHYLIFQDVYEWAGKPRIINIEKSEAVLGDLSVEYSDCFDIERDSETVLSDMNATDWKTLDPECATKQFSDSMSKLWKVHPFREGNTRTVVTFCSLFIEAQGIYIDSNLFKDNAAYMRNALVASNAIFHDLGDLRKSEYLERIVRNALDEGSHMRNRVEKQIQKAGIPVSDDVVRKIVFWNRKTEYEHTSQEIKEYLK